MRAVVVSAAIAAALAGAATTSTALEVQPCDGPRPINAQWERTRLELKEGQRMPAFMGLNCVPSDDSVSVRRATSPST